MRSAFARFGFGVLGRLALGRFLRVEAEQQGFDNEQILLRAARHEDVGAIVDGYPNSLFADCGENGENLGRR